MSKTIVGLNKLATFGEYSHPIELINAIDSAVSAMNNLATEVRKKKSRTNYYILWEDMYEEWGVWSHEFNKLLRIRLGITANDQSPTMIELHNKFSLVYAYWWNRQHWIKEVLCKWSKHAGASKRRGIKRGGKTLKKVIKGNISLSKLSPQFRGLIEQTKKQNYKREFPREDLK